MAVQSPPYALQQGSHSAALFRQATFATTYGPGICGSGELAVAQQSTPNMSVQVAAGRAIVLGTQASAPSGFTWTTQAYYYGLNDASVTLSIAAANASLPRIDVVYLAVNDQQYSGTLNTAVLGVVTGTAASSPTAPAAPANSLVLAQVRVNASVTQILNSNITDFRTYASDGPAAYQCTSSSRPTNVWSGFQIFETDTGRSQIWDASDSLWRATNSANVATSGTRPAAPSTGMALYETDTGISRVYNGSAWVPIGAISATSSSRPASPATGTVIYETDTKLTAVWSGSAWIYTSAVQLNASNSAFKIRTGSANAVFSAISFCVINVTWSDFTGTPGVTATPAAGNSFGTWCEVDSISSTGMTIVVRAGTNITGTIPVQYIAIGR